MAKRLRKICSRSFLSLLLAICIIPATEGHADDFQILRGKTVRILIGGAPNTGADLYARPVIDGLKRLLPESTILAQNLSGGNGALALTEAQSATGNAVTLVTLHNSPIYAQMVGSKLATFDLRQFHWIGALTNNQRIAIVPAALGRSTIDDLRSLPRQLVTVTDDAGSPGHVEALLVSALTGLRLRAVAGVEGSQRTAMLLAGDADFALNSYYALKPLIDSGDFVPVLRIGTTGYPEETDHLPALAEVVNSEAPKVLVDLMETLNVMGRLIAAAPATEPAVVDALRLAFGRIVEDPALAEEYKLRDLILAPTTGSEISSKIDYLLEQDDVRAQLKAYLDCATRLSDGTATSCAP